MSLLTVNQLTKSYQQGQPAVHNMSFELQRGESLGLVGESGCGKSTLARCLLRLEDIDRGEILLNGVHMEKLHGRKLRPLRRHIQIVLQNPAAALNPKLTVRDSLVDPYEQFKQELALKHFTVPSLDRYVQQLLEAVELPASLGSRYPHELSGGQRQRVTIARAISIEPELMILDEPTASLDVLSQGAVLKLLSSLQESLGLSYLFISHDLAAVYQMCPRILVMKDGRLIDQCSREQLFHEERHAYTKELVSMY
ncbi:ABC transporter ATP-binding protein [Paenibacillus sp. F411]|uniref:Oligopeptide ABC transporter ATP-binding protein n=1 Tax=Paenibacillus algicola TaxID=2565926 RepID=A0A4P8XPI2_9BACL|nr:MULTISPECIES: dipeptide/oligopeptide/nickel ABC transporter ATP-binding protein [Paenibacillus]MBO2944524.1 ABC transporter ATP-binding protein [Paenibacillus sp. F411]QCT04847.1 oligopeptide ABC transporter ATP-binding protein [Paenibacillus algicola]